MKVSPGNAVDRFEHDGNEYLFCSTSCAEKFRADAAHYLEKQDEGAHHCDHTCCDHKTCPADSGSRPSSRHRCSSM